MSFKPSAGEQAATGAQQKLADTATANSTAATTAGQGLQATGTAAINPAINYFSTLANGNRANTTALLAPQIAQIKGANDANLSALSTLMPRGGGRSSTLFNAPWQANQQIQSLYNGVAPTAAGNLANIGSGLVGQGANLFGVGNQALNTASNTEGNLFNQAFQQRQSKNNFYSGLGGGLFNLATMPLGGANSPSLLGRIPGLG